MNGEKGWVGKADNEKIKFVKVKYEVLIWMSFKRLSLEAGLVWKAQVWEVRKRKGQAWEAHKYKKFDS